MNVLCFVEPGDELSAQAIGLARALGDVRAVTCDGAYQPAAWAKALAAQDADAIVAAGWYAPPNVTARTSPNARAKPIACAESSSPGSTKQRTFTARAPDARHVRSP